MIDNLPRAGMVEGSLTCNKTTAVCDSQLQRRSCSSLVVAGRVVRVPNQDAWHRSVHAQGHQTRHRESSVGCLYVCNNSVANNGNWQNDKYDETADF